MFNKISKVLEPQNHERGGYFLIFFALVLTILTLPLLGTVLSQTIDVQGNIADFRDANYARSGGDTMLNTVMRQNKQHGLGYFELGTYPPLEEDDSYEDGDLRVNYFYNSASIFPVPTNLSVSPTGLDPKAKFLTFSESDVPVLSPTAGVGGCRDNEVLNQAYECEDISDYSAAYYTVPALGTGNAGENCEYFKVNEGKVYPGITDSTGAVLTVDPLDDPCNWNTLALGETVGIPLYFKYKNSFTDEIETFQFDPSTLKLRVRLACADGSPFCPNERRLVFEAPFEFGIDDDDSQRVFNWVVQDNLSGQVFIADQRWYPDEEYRSDDNSELTVNRLSLGYREDDEERFYSQYGLHLVNFLNIPVELIQVAFSEDTLFDSEDLILARLSSLFTEGVIVLEFINDVYEASDESNVRYIEYQLVSDVPLGNTDFVATGTAASEEEENYTLRSAKILGPEFGLPGLVFGN